MMKLTILEVNMVEFIQVALAAGGPVMYVIALFLFITIYLFFARSVALFLRYDTPNAKGMWAEIYRLITSNQIETAIRLCEKSPRGQIVPRILKKGLQSAARSAQETQHAVDSVSLELVPLCKRYLSWLGTIANITTLLGLLGTIAGLIKSFGAVASLTGSAKQEMLAAGISHALYATGFGLGVAMLAMLIHGLLSFQATKVSDEADEYGAKLIELLQMRRSNLTARKA
jgi:biopolymer transport protein ExbB/TolQ